MTRSPGSRVIPQTSIEGEAHMSDSANDRPRFSFHRDEDGAPDQPARAGEPQPAADAWPAAVKPAPERNPMFVERTSTRVRVYTPAGILVGDHHHAAGVRLSDALRNQVTGEKYMMLTNVEILRPDGTPMADGVGHAEFVLINTQHCSVVMPLDEQDAAAA
jgi:hypothetical protein